MFATHLPKALVNLVTESHASTLPASVGFLRVCPYFISMTHIREKCMWLVGDKPVLVLSRSQSTNGAQKLQSWSVAENGAGCSGAGVP